MKKLFYKGRFFFIPLGIAACLSLVSVIVMLLWNNLLPDIMNVSAISFWQAMGIFILCKILFGFGGGRHKGGPSWINRCKNMSPEEKEKFRAEMKERMCFMRNKHSGNKNEHTEQQNS
ncbi:hypothetical protein ACFSJU_09405 [Paradesertivirga mongoliensis]|uniref:Uncharacterized protein n=1 Tax=Paradesertivirga mongoliensis TaxID=2100740 RepID=A0ABW4ZLE7_9SPHI|nr:hypothetical protein [Pedobacter mongoliensis]